MISSESRIERESTKLTPSDIICGILAHCQENDFVYPEGNIHAVVAELREAYPILAPFVFNPGDTVPFSDKLERALNILLRSRIFYPPDSTYDRNSATEKGKSYIKERILPRFTQDELKQLRALGKEFDERLSLR